jgi:hypothetical protein
MAASNVRGAVYDGTRSEVTRSEVTSSNLAESGAPGVDGRTRPEMTTGMAAPHRADMSATAHVAAAAMAAAAPRQSRGRYAGASYRDCDNDYGIAYHGLFHRVFLFSQLAQYFKPRAVDSSPHISA